MDRAPAALSDGLGLSAVGAREPRSGLLKEPLSEQRASDGVVSGRELLGRDPRADDTREKEKRAEGFRGDAPSQCGFSLHVVGPRFTCTPI